MFLITATVGAAVIAGCGGDGSDASAGGDGQGYPLGTRVTVRAASPAVTKPQFVRRINETCREAWIVILDNFAKYSSWQDPKRPAKERFEESVRLSLLAGLNLHILDEIQNLGSAPGEEAEIEEMLSTLYLAVELAQRRVALSSVGEIEEHFNDYNQQARRYGLDSCLVDEAHLRPIET